eukprot:CAMPEP_0175041864 /NCGR_PEP_ID=MMETSP0052_2-20121109/2187_1 /TAXON_ID=51329 ORGANISM="Polytomella parva, Strain SAG 63-3" /NCGR_SAMPLE_ID=MMETSP0052_2 /ASSEMBLY_ACC=CAM_ASM_000194 /LENGTH=412 /DNA_ID=CAMNT_0016304497 /DNA_START=167 /DNA_END=1403 /DNA_ORIENTATION=-
MAANIQSMTTASLNAITVALVLDGLSSSSSSSTAASYSANALSTYSACLLARTPQASFAFNISHYATSSAATNNTGNSNNVVETFTEPDRVRILGAKNNRVLGGLLLYQERRINSDAYTGSKWCRRSSFANLISSCETGLDYFSSYDISRMGMESDSMSLADALTLPVLGEDRVIAMRAKSAPSAPSGGVGVDPFFNSISNLYNSSLNASDFYDTSGVVASEYGSDLNGASYPYGFFPTSTLEGSPGYPVLFDVRLGSQRTSDMISYLSNGSYLSSTMSRKLTAQLVTYNSDARVFGYGKITFTWLESGVIKATIVLQGLPIVRFNQSFFKSTDCIPTVLLFILVAVGLGLTVVEVYDAFLVQLLASRSYADFAGDGTYAVPQISEADLLLDLAKVGKKNDNHDDDDDDDDD